MKPFAALLSLFVASVLCLGLAQGTPRQDERPTLKRSDPEHQWEIDQGERDKSIPPRSTVVDIKLLQMNLLSPDVQGDLIGRYKGETFDNAGWVGELRERVRDAWRQLGYFFAEVESSVEVADAKGALPKVVVYVTVRPGDVYRLVAVRWNRVAVFSTEDLRPLIPLQDGEIFDVRKIREGLEALRTPYLTKGYLDFTSVPETKIDSLNKTILLTIDVDEGDVFTIKSVRVLGGDSGTRATITNPLKIGDTYNPELVETIFEKELRPRLPKGRNFFNVVETSIDEAAHKVGIIVDLRSME